MLDNTMTMPKKETADYTPLPEDVYTVELLDVNAEARPTYDTRNESDDKKIYETVLNFHFVLLDGEEKGTSLRGRSVWQNFVPSFLYISKKNGKNRLYNIVEAFQGSELSPQQEAEGISGEFVNSLIGKQCRVATSNKVNGDKTFTNIDKFLPVKVQLEALTEQEKIEATPKAKEAEEATAQYEGEEVTN